MSVAENQVIDIMRLADFPGSGPDDQLSDVTVVEQPITVNVGGKVG